MKSRTRPKDDRQAIDATLESAQAASHRIQDYPFCLRATAMVNAIRSHWSKFDSESENVVENFANNPLNEEFCPVHRVMEDFSFRYNDSRLRSLPIPEFVLRAGTLREIAEAYRRKPEQLAEVNRLVQIDRRLAAQVPVKIPEPDFVLILAARLSPAVHASSGLAEERRSALIQRLVPLALTNRTALDTILGRLLLSARGQKFPMPGLLASLDVPSDYAAPSHAEQIIH